MAICNTLTSGIGATCDNNIGGIKKIYLTDFANIATITHGSPGDTITAITMAMGKVFYEFVFNKNTSTFEEVTPTDPSNGSELCTQTITLVHTRRDQTKRDTILLLGKFKPLGCIIKDANDKYWLMGETEGVMLTNKQSGPGTVKSDRNGYVLTLVGEEPEDACEILSSVISGLI